MASEIVKDIDEKFCQCSICLEQFEEPKLLPCLHRFCKDCLAEVIKQHRGYVACPVCREECIIPNEGLDGFKTDFYMKNIIEYIQLQTSLEDNHMQECCGCSKTLKVSAYCFKCNDFLCESCHQFHVTSKITKDHRPHTLTVEDVVSKRLTLDKLASLKEASRCCTHSEKLSELCCKTCSNTPICIACTYGNHDGHDFREVTALANEERQKLKQELAELLSYEDKILKVPQRLKKVKHEIATIVLEKKKCVQAELVDKKVKIDEKLQDLETKYKLSKEEEEEKLNKELSLLQQEMEKELQKIKEKYNKLYDEKRQKFNKILEISKKEHEEKALKLREKLSVLTTGCNEATESLLRQQQENIKKAQAIDDQFESMITRFENMKTTTSTLLESMNDWTVVQCSSDILTAKKPLIEEMRKDIPKLDDLTEIEMKPLPDISFSLNNRVFIATHAAVMKLKKILPKEGCINDITIQNGRIVVTGSAGMYRTHISVTDITSKLILQKVLRASHGYTYPRCMCDLLSGSVIITASDLRELGTYDTDSQIYSGKNVRAVTNEWPQERGVTSVASDTRNNQIFLGNSGCKHLYVFDLQLNVRRKLILPTPLIGCHDVVVSGRNLIVCDYYGKIAIAMNMEGKVVYEFKKPGDDSGDWKPMDACTDSRGFVYILWGNDLHGYSSDRVIAQNSLDINHVLSVIPVDIEASCLTTMEVNGKERLLVATRRTRKIFSYNLVPEW